ncbi:MAG: hypothetical protein CL843_16295 [Crocinitomicaceae bacterium]|nr:hypothetical protein [Crocinitomicaceae bacterium]|tara:strand:- start:7865 stop:8254 length:390 start_codon:yes stop_codon:yes gene_type:complete
MKNKITWKPTQIQELRSKYSSNQQRILRVTGLSEEDYFWKIVEIGCQLLHELYPKEEGYENYYESIAYSSDYWKWFKYEWKVFENNIIEGYAEDLCLEVWLNEVEVLPTSDELEHCYNTFFLKYSKFKI